MDNSLPSIKWVAVWNSSISFPSKRKGEGVLEQKDWGSGIVALARRGNAKAMTKFI